MQPYGKHTSWVKCPWNDINLRLEYPLNSLNLVLGKMCEPCNSFLAKVRESQRTWIPKVQGESGNFAEKLGWNAEGVSHNFAKFTVIKSCFLRVNCQIKKILGVGGGSEKYI